MDGWDERLAVSQVKTANQLAKKHENEVKTHKKKINGLEKDVATQSKAASDSAAIAKSHEEEAGKHKVASKELEVCVDRGLIRVGWSVECGVWSAGCRVWSVEGESVAENPSLFHPPSLSGSLRPQTKLGAILEEKATLAKELDLATSPPTLLTIAEDMQALVQECLKYVSQSP